MAIRHTVYKINQFKLYKHDNLITGRLDRAVERRILHIIPSASSGGIESFVVSLLENIDKDKFKLDFAAFNPNNPIHKEYMEMLCANVYFIGDAGSKTTVISKIIWRFIAVINFYKLIKRNKYDVIHCHNYSNFGIYVLLAALKGIPVRIVHSHNAGGISEYWFSETMRKFKNFVSFECLITHKIGCSDTATKWFYGTNSLHRGKAVTIYNGIDMNKFSANDDRKQIIRRNYFLEDGIHFIHVGRFTILKNQLFLLGLFNEMLQSRNDLYLNIVGFGPLEKTLKERVKILGIEEKVKFYKFDTNIPELLKAMDFFLLPSYSEAFPISAIEAQVSKVPIFISDKVTKEVDMGLAVYLPIDNGEKYWADYVLDAIKNRTYPKTNDPDKTKLFDIKTIVNQFEDIYE